MAACVYAARITLSYTTTRDTILTRRPFFGERPGSDTTRSSHTRPIQGVGSSSVILRCERSSPRRSTNGHRFYMVARNVRYGGGRCSIRVDPFKVNRDALTAINDRAWVFCFRTGNGRGGRFPHRPSCTSVGSTCGGQPSTRKHLLFHRHQGKIVGPVFPPGLESYLDLLGFSFTVRRGAAKLTLKVIEQPHNDTVGEKTTSLRG